eukprot:2798247-Amphidinium_carterae.1
MEAGVRDRLIHQWGDVVILAGEHSGLWTQLVGLGEEERFTVLRDTFRVKSSATLRKRLCSLLEHVRWCRSETREPFPFGEPVSYSSVCFLRANGRAPTAA